MNNDRAKVNKLTVYLIKDRFASEIEILKTGEGLKKIELSNEAILYYDDSQVNKPRWVRDFFENKIEEASVFNSGSKALLIVKRSIGSKRLSFAIPFGYGWTLLKPGVWEERFGLKIALNSINSAGLRRITKKNITTLPKDSSEQLGKAGQISDFGLDIEQDLIQEITAISNDKLLGKTVTGKDPLSISVKVSISNVGSFLDHAYSKYISEEYKEDFGWIDQVSDVKDIQLIDSLNAVLINRLRDLNFEKVWMAVPELVEWEKIEGFCYVGRRRDPELHDDLHLSKYIEVALNGRDHNDLLLTDFDSHVTAISSDNNQPIHRWKAYNCLYCEVEKDGQTYLLSNGKWYEIEKQFADEINSEYYALRDQPASIELPQYNNKSEAEYNLSVAAERGYVCMDRNNIQYGGGYSKIEFCDLLTPEKQLIHVKRYGNSSVLSHLFSQGLVSAELFLSDTAFRKKLNEKLPQANKLANPEEQPNSSNYGVVFAIVSSSNAKLEIPFFSKVALRNAKRRLLTFGYKVSLVQIHTQET